MAPTKSILLPLLAALPHASAWGSLGHTTVAFIAQNFVATKTATFAKNLLGDTSTAYMANVATWADTYRSEAAGKFSSGFHYIDALDNPPKTCGVIYERDCPDGCIVSAIANYTTRAVQTSLEVVEQQKALKWLIHFIGDIHQPLHVENLDVGGNTINVTFDGAKTNLHAAWDTAIPQKVAGTTYSIANAQAWATNLTTEIKTGKFKSQAASWKTNINVNTPINTTMLWAVDTNSYVCTTVLPKGVAAVNGQEIDNAYYKTAAPVVQLQIAKAGIRLAAYLDALVAKTSAKASTLKREVEGEMEEYSKREFALEPWMVEAKEKRSAFGDCNCGEADHTH
ncbi:hypothetical protein P153DRAFT_293141 [Dothidotthia symphoricarpi CBS 119687]|uniref:Nuclease s1 n=1 Tax=Dothidotthia symphoricarpi CBS 119687 TaxID=1392245 RepID=A0A6A6AC76_9PLEO|nr:uncharacterized protein P153DRAFT_293141 [Dothidotthia symphoricarpi CBS 119687]KAF2128508.1 hypothetical protein P153DRAFT_293141 [Dothidotthia symphoricarpi CBS 119687]